jgi:hypothetical protein
MLKGIIYTSVQIIEIVINKGNNKITEVRTISQRESQIYLTERVHVYSSFCLAIYVLVHRLHHTIDHCMMASTHHPFPPTQLPQKSC